MQPKPSVAAMALLVAALAVSATRITAEPETRPDPRDVERYALVALVGDQDGSAPGFVPSRPAPPRMRPVGASAETEWATPHGNPFGALAPTTSVWGIPELVLAAYRNAELALQSSAPECGLSWNLLAGIGKVESDHAAAGRTDVAGTTTTPILGPALDGTLPGNEVIPAAGGAGYVHALGPMQFLPDTWHNWGSDGNADGVADPDNVFDAALAAGRYLCADGVDLRDPAGELAAILRYNHSMSYAAKVLGWAAAYRNGGVPVLADVSTERVPPATFDASRASVSPDATTGPTEPQSDAPTTVSEPRTISPAAVETRSAPSTTATPTPRSPRLAPSLEVARTPVEAAPDEATPEPDVAAPAAQPQTYTPQTLSPRTIAPETIAPQTYMPQLDLTSGPEPEASEPGASEPHTLVPSVVAPTPAVPAPTVQPQLGSAQPSVAVPAPTVPAAPLESVPLTQN